MNTLFGKGLQKLVCDTSRLLIDMRGNGVNEAECMSGWAGGVCVEGCVCVCVGGGGGGR